MADAAQRKRRGAWLKLGAGVAVGALVLGGAWGYGQVEPYARIGSAYMAKQMCSCLFVAGRSDGSCRREFEPGVRNFSLAIDRAGLPERAEVKSTIAVVFHGRARYERAFGCTIPR